MVSTALVRDARSEETDLLLRRIHNRLCILMDSMHKLAVQRLEEVLLRCATEQALVVAAFSIGVFLHLGRASSLLDVYCLCRAGHDGLKRRRWVPARQANRILYPFPWSAAFRILVPLILEASLIAVAPGSVRVHCFSLNC